ncbi:hypothetical protein SDJN03_24200, partial [Cucurbita argyrosperma subsp. sororia]
MGLLLNCAYLVILIGAHDLSGALRQLGGLSIGSTAGAEERDDLPHPYSFMNQTIKYNNDEKQRQKKALRCLRLDGGTGEEEKLL